MQPLRASCTRSCRGFKWAPTAACRLFWAAAPAPLRAQCLCQHCDHHAVGDKSHMHFVCPALQGVGDKYAALFC